ncbi:MAG: DNA mismatch repair endonuclease MutL [Treponema sp.]|jgi:DNA mismatch repair protein MutL|nr:DNA mismatch repair endonuclease MutL [Treponema sp.]
MGAIRLLPPEEARKIAAGEVIDRPAALVREFVDNAIDAGSSRIEVLLEGGGCRGTEVIDDGAGMTKEDLELCWQTHATSKIRSIEDLATAETLGFRGEALAAAAAVSRLEILSASGEGEAWLLQTGGGREFRLTPGRRTRGTTVRALGLFDVVPARKRFLKREGAEGSLCKQVLVDKALAFPGISFRLTLDGRPDLFFPEAASYKERFTLALLSQNERGFLHEISARGQGFSVCIVAGGPELVRQDRRRQFVFANGRRISDFSLLQAFEYGLQGWFPNGTHPVGAIFIDIDPALADFNIHPAKREVRFRDPGAVHHAVTSTLRDFTRRRDMSRRAASVAENVDRPWISPGFLSSGFLSPGFSSPGLSMEALLEHPPVFAPLPRKDPAGDMAFGEAAEACPSYLDSEFPDSAEPRLMGMLFGLFILVEWKDSLFIIDQHAAHERILYDRFAAGDIPRQELLAPIPFSTESAEDDRFLQKQQRELARLGVLIAPDDSGGAGAWRIEALPSDWRLSDGDTVRELLALRDAGENIAERWAATLCCHGAVKDGDYLDSAAALSLARAALRLPVPRCPHGRPLWKELSREDLFRAVKRL